MSTVEELYALQLENGAREWLCDILQIDDPGNFFLKKKILKRHFSILLFKHVLLVQVPMFPLLIGYMMAPFFAMLSTLFDLVL